MNEIKYRYAQQKDIDIVQDLLGDFYFYHKDVLVDTIKKKRIIVATDNETPIALLHISAKKDRILMLIVRNKYKGRGIAMKLFKIAQVLYQLKTIHISATVESIPFWEKCGFQKTGVIKKTKTRELIEMIYN